MALDYLQVKFPDGMSARDRGLLDEGINQYLKSGKLNQKDPVKDLKRYVLQEYKIQVDCWFKYPPTGTIQGLSEAEGEAFQAAVNRHFQKQPAISQEDAQGRMQALVDGYLAGRQSAQ
ncbi:MAG: hypothetical protein AAFZ35_17205 [Cyanobacteria bacterium J06649_12]